MVSPLLFNGNETYISNMWQDFSNKNKVALYVCMSAALRRGILKDKKKFDDDGSVLLHGVFRVCGLSSIMENVLLCDRFIQF